MDREKVIKGLECHAEVNCVECPYRDGWRTCPFGETLLADALALLKEQEAEILFLKGMQLKMIHNMSEVDIGNTVTELLQLKGR